MKNNYDVLIAGAGAAGLMCAIEAGKRGRRVLLIDKAKSIGEKIRISGGGRCNFTNLHTSPTNYLSQNPHFCVSALKRYNQHDFIAMVESHNIAYHEKTLGQLFCDGSAKQIIAMLKQECEQADVTIATETTINQITPQNEGFHITLSNETQLNVESLVIATGGPSIPKMGATEWGFQVAEQFDLKLVPPHAALVPFTLDSTILENTKALAGVSLEIIASCNNISFREAMLFTHRGLSGPAILQISSYWQEGNSISLNLLPDTDMLEVLKQARNTTPKQTIRNILQNMLPKRLAHYLCNTHSLEGKLADFSNNKLQHIADMLHAWQITPNGTEGYRTAEVTRGGVDTNELSSKTFETRKVSGLYFIGEVVDVTGHLGGFNFQWAWSSGHAAGQYV